MNYTIWQLPVSHHNCFKGTIFDLEEIKLKDYVLVYDGYMETENFNEGTLDYIYEILNIDHPEDYHARSLSVSDIIQVRCESNKNKWFYVDSFGFKELDEKEIMR